MASVFLSYDHEDAALAAPIASALEKAGHSVWWDRHIHGGAEYNSEIEGAVARADAVVVLWSERSVRSAWVRDEAAEGRDQGKLVPVALDRTKPPMGFRQYQTIPLPEWRGRKPPAGMAELLHAIEKIAGGPVSPAPARTSAGPQRTPTWVPLRWAALGVAMILAVVALFAWQPWGQGGSAAVAAVLPADPSPASQDLARDLLAQLGELQASRRSALELVGSERRRGADVVFEVAASTGAQQSRANVVMLDGNRGTLLWSKAFERPSGKAGDLREEVGYTAAQVLGCAIEAHPRGRSLLKTDTLKLYLQGCAELADAELEKFAPLVPLFRQIVDAAPAFEGGWSKLLKVEEQMYFVSSTAVNREQLQRDIASARKVNPRLGAAYAAEAGLLPSGAWAERLAIVDRAVAANPEDAWLHSLRAEALTGVGRMREAIDDSRAAKRIDPLTPGMRAAYVFALAQGGQSEAALREIDEAERLWPGSSNVAGAKFAFHLRFGDPRIALQFIRSGTLPAAWAQGESFVRARIDPTPANVDRALKDAEAVYKKDSYVLQHWVQALSTFDREDELLALLMRVPVEQAQFVTDVTFRPAAREFWRNRRSLEYAKRVGLLQYWQASGKWPDFCGETDLPYDCKKEAAKLIA